MTVLGDRQQLAYIASQAADARLNVELETEGYPLRKDFPLLARIVKPWPGIVDVEPIPAQFDTDAEPEATADAEAAS